MYKKIDGVNINYITYGNEDGLDVILLHGWGQNINMMKPIGDNLKKDYHITIIDLPGFGSSSEPETTYTVYDYAKLLNKFLKELNINKPILVGHSFGGKISLVYSSMYDVVKLVVFGSPFTKEITKLSMKTKALKTLKKVPILNKFENTIKKYVGSTDYRNSTPMMRSILTDTVNRDIKEDVKKIKCPTLIVWGSNDEAVSLERAYELEKLISNAGVVVYEGNTHYAYLERLNQTVNVLKSFFNS